MIRGMIESRDVMLSEIGRTLREDQALLYTVKRLSRNLNSDRLDCDRLQHMHLERAAARSSAADGEGVVVAVDYTDISKPWARPDRRRGMEGACRCHDGSAKHSKMRTGMGYPVVEIDAHLPSGSTVPLVRKQFSYGSGSFKSGSQNKEFLTQIATASQYVGERAWWTFDRGFDAATILRGLDELALRWVVRLKIDRNTRGLALSDGRIVSAHDAALEAIPRYKARGGHGKRRDALEIGARVVRLTDQKKKPSPQGPERTLVVVWGLGKEPLALLASERLSGKREVVGAYRAYLRRWKAEESIRAAKDSLGWGLDLENVRALKLRGVQRLALLSAIVYSFLSEVCEAKRLREEVALLARALGREPADPIYRVIRGAGGALNRVGERQYERFRAAA